MKLPRTDTPWVLTFCALAGVLPVGCITKTGDTNIGVSEKCGNGVFDGAEECDDANKKSGDGCSSRCEIEMGFECDEEGDACTSLAEVDDDDDQGLDDDGEGLDDDEEAPCVVGSGATPEPIQLAAGAFHSCARLSNGTVRCWTDNNNVGQLGDGSTAASRVPKEVPNLTGIVDLAAGDLTTCTVDCAGVARCWGGGSWGQLGNGTVENSLVPVEVDLPGPAQRVFVGKSATACAILQESRQVWCWGSNFSGALGNGTETGETCASGATNCVATPTRVQGSLTDSRFLALGGPFGCAVAGNNQVACWGANSSGQLEIEDLSNQLVAGGLSTGPAFAVLVGGQSHMCGAWELGESRGIGWCWGANTFGQLGRGTRDDQANDRYEKAGDLEQVIAMAAGSAHTCAVKDDGTVYCWGRNDLGQLGLGNADGEVHLNVSFVSTPTLVPDLSGVAQIAAGDEHTCVLDDRADVYCWGDNSTSQIGDGTRSGDACFDGELACRLSPTLVIGW